jgi:hypothetical protein
MDKGYDSGAIHEGCMDRDVCPVTALANTGRAKRGEHKPPRCEHGEWTFAGADFRRKATGLDRVRLHADLTILAKLACALSRARAVPLAA